MAATAAGLLLLAHPASETPPLRAHPAAPTAPRAAAPTPSPGTSPAAPATSLPHGGRQRLAPVVPRPRGAPRRAGSSAAPWRRGCSGLAAGVGG